jgi:ribosomal protein S18 acetylase RimI-like enzyme
MTRDGTIRRACPEDLDQIVDIYLGCFPERAGEVFGPGSRRELVRDYLAFYLSWDPAHNWVYARESRVLGFLIAPAIYSPLRSALSGPVLHWLAHLLSGRYGAPWRLALTFLRTGFSFRTEPAVRTRWGRPYIHGVAVAPEAARQRVGIGAALIRHMLSEHARAGVTYCWGLVPSWNAWAVEFHRRLGAQVEATLSNGDQIVAYRLVPPETEARPPTPFTRPA